MYLDLNELISMKEALLGFEQGWTPIFDLTAPHFKLLALRDLQAY